MKRFVYADNAGTTPMSKTALDAMLPYLTTEYGNPSGIYSLGRTAKKALETARETVARDLNAEPSEIYFTGGGTEGDNWALRGALELKAKTGKHIIISAVEHHADLHSCEHLKKKYGAEITLLPVDQFGWVNPEDLRAALRDDTILCSVMLANNEIGTIEPIRALAEIAHERGVLFHTDAVQAVGHIPVDVKELGVDMLSLSAHKFCGPKGVGAMFIKKGVNLPPLLDGGGHERGKRSGTENVAGICGLAAALDEAVANMGENMKKVSAMRDKLIENLLQVPRSRLTGDPVNRLPGTASFVFACIEGESIILSLDAVGICASSGSACSSGSLDPSHVLMAIGLPHEVAHGSVRLTLNEMNTMEDVDYILEQLPPIIKRLRSMSPLWEE
ncbi:MAG: cysteine desulfurase NifS [Firmicutes bacterium]|nr:cysteine desulfurase NifS [Bacillota bacterium]